MYWGQKPTIHLIGIGGSGMSGIAEVLLASGFPVSGSDLHKSVTTERLARLGAKIFEGHFEKNISQPTCVVVSSAISKENPEWVEAKRKGIPIIARAEMLAELMRLKMGVSIAGSHGKTTTTSMVGQILRPLDPTVVVGGRVQHWDASTVIGKGTPFVIEADESDRSFLKFSPVYSVVTNIDREHLDTYKNLEDIEDTFVQYLNRTAFFGLNWICADCPSLTKIRSRVSKPTKTYGFHESADLRIVSTQFLGQKSKFRVEWEGKNLPEFELPVMGLHNISNATAAIGIGISCGLSLEEIRTGLKNFIPADRRLQVHVEGSSQIIVEDYGHHPTEVKATLDALKLMYPAAKLLVFFQPHRFTRTQALFDEFAPSFEGRCDEVFLLPIYSAHEKPIDGISSETLAKTFRNTPVRALPQAPTADDIFKLTSIYTEQVVILILGAGPLTSIAVNLAKRVRSAENIDAEPIVTSHL